MLVCTCVSGIAGAKCVVRLGVGGGTIKMVFSLWLPMYCTQWNFKVCMIWAHDIPIAF